MPFLRVIRDRRGYETTYLMDWYREGARQRSRILYVFRTPGSVRVGREPLDAEALRSIESLYPDIAFDWKAMLGQRQVIEPAPEPRRPRMRRRLREEVSVRAAAGREEEEPPSVPQRAGRAPLPAGPPVPSAIEGATPDEQIAFLTTWYPIVRERIPQRTADPARREALLALADRMNPAAWTDADTITTGLLDAAEALQRLSRVFARRRRRARRRPAADTGEATPVSPALEQEPSPDDGARRDAIESVDAPPFPERPSTE